MGGQAKKQPDMMAKVIIIGDSGVGKTNLLTRFCQGIFKDSYVATIGVDFKIKTMNCEGMKIKLQIWDTAGQERFKNITSTYYKGAAGIILTYAINSKQSFKNVNNWIKQVETSTDQNVCKILIATKSDLEESREVDIAAGQKLAQEHGMKFLEVSSKENKNVQQTFFEISKQIKNKKQSIPVQKSIIGLKGKNQNKKICCL